MLGSQDLLLDEADTQQPAPTQSKAAKGADESFKEVDTDANETGSRSAVAAPAPAQSDADDEESWPASRPKKLVRRTKIVSSDDSDLEDEPQKRPPTPGLFSPKASAVDSQLADPVETEDRGTGAVAVRGASNDDVQNASGDEEVDEPAARKARASDLESSGDEDGPQKAAETCEKPSARKARMSDLESSDGEDGPQEENEKSEKPSARKARVSDLESSDDEDGERTANEGRKKPAARMARVSDLESSESDGETTQSKRRRDGGSDASGAEQDAARGTDNEDGEHSKIKPRPPRVSMREQLRREGLLDSDDEDNAAGDGDPETQQMLEERDDIRREQQRLMRKSGELKCLRSKKVTIESIKEKILGKTAPAAQAQQHAPNAPILRAASVASSSSSASRARGRGLDAFLTADRKPFAFSPHGKGKPRPAGDRGAEESAEQGLANGDESDADDLIVLDAAPANRTTLRQNLLRIAATERAKAKEGKQTIRLEDEEAFDEDEEGYLDNDDDGEEDDEAGAEAEELEGSGAEQSDASGTGDEDVDGSDCPESDADEAQDDGDEEGDESRGSPARPARPGFAPLHATQSTNLLDNLSIDGSSQQDSRSAFETQSSYIRPHQPVVSQAKLSGPVTDTQDLGSIFTRGTNYSAASASQQDAFPLSAGNSVQLDEDGFFRRPAAMASRTYARKGPMPADVTQDVDMDTQPLTAREVRTQVRPSQFAAALGDDDDLDISLSDAVRTQAPVGDVEAGTQWTGGAVADIVLTPEDDNEAPAPAPAPAQAGPDQLLSQLFAEDDEKETDGDAGKDKDDDDEDEDEDEVIVKKIGAVVDTHTLAERLKKKKAREATMFDEEAELSGDELESDEDEDALDEGEEETVPDEEVEAGDEDAMRKRHLENVMNDDEAEIEAIKAGVMGYKRKGDFDDDLEAQLAAAARRANARMRRDGDDSNDSLYGDGIDFDIKDKLWDGADMGPDDADEVLLHREKLEKMSFIMQQQEANSRKNLDSLLDADSQHLLSRIASTSRLGATARPAPLKTSHSLPAPLKRFGSVSNTSSFLNRAGAKLVPKPKPKQADKPDAPNVLRATSSRGSFVFSTNSRDSLSNQAPTRAKPAKPAPFAVPGKPAAATGKVATGKPAPTSSRSGESLFAALSKNKFDIKQAK